jgi:peptidoglycan hydrolase CwlO-like protein
LSLATIKQFDIQRNVGMGNVKMTILVTLALGASVASADKLSDFKDAVAKKGCESIPYSDYRSSCQSQQSQVHDWCDGSRGPVTCGSENVTRQVKDNLEKERRAVQELKDKRGKLQDNKSRASTDDEKNKIGKDIEQADKDIYDAEKRVEQAQKGPRNDWTEWRYIGLAASQISDAPGPPIRSVAR